MTWLPGHPCMVLKSLKQGLPYVVFSQIDKRAFKNLLNGILQRLISNIII